uniref:RNase H type-1 domain-containing protein n=1 Tax=Cannabis sativa TaxID=3483 RepID=A0A803PUS8_CANSA
MGKEIAGIQIDKNSAYDSLIWKDSTVGKFSVKGAYWLDQKARFRAQEPLWKWIWDSKVHPRLSMMLWRACMNVLPTGDKQGSSGDNIAALVSNLYSSSDPSSRIKLLILFGVLMDCIWKTRKTIVHNEVVQPSIDAVRRDISNKFSEMISDSDFVQRTLELNAPALFPRLTTDCCILVDGSFQDGKFGCAMLGLSKDSMDWWKCTSSGSFNLALEAEMQALLLGLQWAAENQWNNVSFVTNSKSLVDGIRTRHSPDWKLAASFSLFLHLLSSFSYSIAGARWAKPTAGFLKINVDGALFAAEKAFGGGGLVRDSGGFLLEGFAFYKSGSPQPAVAEIMSIKEALSWVENKRWGNVIVVSNSLTSI